MLANTNKWNLNSLKVTDFEAELERFKTESRIFIDKWKNNGDYLNDSVLLKSALDEYEEWVNRWSGGGKLGYYFWLRLELDQNNPNLKAKNNLIEETVRMIGNEMRFFEHNLALIDQGRQEKFLEDKALEKYHHYLERLFAEAKYLLSMAEENIIELLDKPARQNWVAMTSELLSKELIKGKTMEEMLNAMRDKDKVKRDKAALLFNQLMMKYEDIAEIELNSILEDKKVVDLLRKIDRPDRLRHTHDDIESEVVDGMISAANKSNAIPARFYRLKAKLLGLPQLAYHERNVNYGVIDKKYSYKQGVELVKTVFKNLDPEFHQILTYFLDQGLVDVAPKKGKAGGAFCVGFTKILPTYILLNWTNSFHDVTTLAHEAGHGINNELMKPVRHGLSWGTPTSTAEVASTFFEDFVMDYLAQKANEETRLAIMMSKLDSDISSIWRQAACYRFEQQLHQEYRKLGYLSKKQIGELFQKEMRAYMGEAVEQSEGSQNWWIYWSHIRRYFYVYSYASGQLISKSMQHAVREDKTFITKVKRFLAAGTSESPKEIFLKMGIDITDRAFWDKGIAEVERLLSETEKLAIKLGKI